MRVFTRVLERRSFTLAAEDLNLPRSTVTDAVKQIEKRLGVRLLERTTRQVTPTLDGDNFYHRCLSIIRDVEDAESAFSGLIPTGRLRVDVHGTLARHFLLPKLPHFLQNYPEIELFMSEDDRLVDLVREGIDCVLRVGTPQVEELVARHIATLEEVSVASVDYVRQFGLPSHPDDLAEHQMIGFRATGSSEPMPLEFTINNKIVHQSLPTSLIVNSAETLVSAARQGLGIVQVPRYHVEKDLAQGLLIELLSDYPPTPSPVSIIYPSNRKHSPRVRVFIEWLQEAFEMPIHE
ncbi:LysR family transcriptional regulator [Photobacterium sp. OFAV2-7]|uniref:LysR family transcriptional regulator n=1 Tax=Photobacterium sp. OFAV2-7 TaxID=2917748 RepID=UPI001EF6B62C|nr:LysR family transcriptional regulator [Photobacterium sp. OFAV2-7]MCG7588620.1 LysR family transcriptional regulator [Photobacterium sp. OFAV2-7]